ncbi:ABC transporter permease [Opitutus terrae]|uniref:Permease n=1 Tax=Opitutus terrae (strain DSM 11246 / JCM 15787 / PB90-1) TaxID=452637 RepID=B1ZXY7_OPITP|nr:ABC transporter permease [Opitutus terrae]ACB75189.1 permease [Opitutus terrae PB90-1]
MTDLRFALRQLRKSPGYTTIAVLTLALGIGLNTSIFSVLNLLLLAPLPYPQSERLVRIYAKTPQSDAWGLTPVAYYTLRDANPQFGLMGGFLWWGATLTEPDRPAEVLVSMRVSPELLPTLAVPPLLGRWFTREEDLPGSPVIIVSESLWRRWFNSDPDVIGRSVRVDGQAVTIVGVMPASMAAPIVFGDVDFIRPMGLTTAERTSRVEHWMHLVARLRPGQSLAAARAEMDALAIRLQREHPEDFAQLEFNVLPLHASGVDLGSRQVTWLSLGLAAFVLAIACANLANLQLVRASGRTREYAVRAALGASRVHLLRPLLWEGAVVSLAGGVAGLVVARVCNGWIGAHVVFNNTHVGHALPLDGRVLAFATIASLITGLASATAPAWWIARGAPGAALKEQGRGATASRGQQTLRRGLVVAEFALALVLLAGAGLMLGGLNRFLHRDIGWRPEGIVHGYVPTQTPGYARDDAVVHRFYERVLERMRELPGVQSATFSWELPIAGYNSARRFVVDGRPAAQAGDEPVAFFNGAFPGYFETLDIALLAGRDFTRHDGADAPRVAIVNESLARAFWPGESALGRRVSWGPLDAPVWLEIVGVVRDVQFPGTLTRPVTQFQVYVPCAQEVWRWGAFALRTKVAPEAMVESMRRVVAEVDREIPMWEPRAMTTEIDRRLANSTLIGQLLGGVAVLGLLLAALGIYGVIAQTVVQRTPEIGVRLALGADARAIYRLVLGSGLRLAVAGVACGTIGAYFVSRVLANRMPELPPPGGAVPFGAIVALLGAALAACWLPARRAMRVDPVIALRSE